MVNITKRERPVRGDGLCGPPRDPEPDTSDALEFEWLWSRSCSSFHCPVDVADPDVRAMLDRYNWRTWPNHGDRAEVIQAEHEISAERRRLKRSAGRDVTWAGERRGSGNPMAKLDEAAVLWLREQVTDGRKIRDVARDLGVSHNCVYQAARGHTWSHVKVASP